MAWQIVEIAGGATSTAELAFANTIVSIADQVPRDLARSFVIGSARVASGVEEGTMFRYQLFPPTSLSASRNGGAGAAIVRYHVVEAPSVQVERGTYAFMTGNTAQIPLARLVDPSRTMVLTSASGGSVGGTGDRDELLATGTIVDGGTALLLQRNSMPATVTNAVSAWSVIEWL